MMQFELFFQCARTGRSDEWVCAKKTRMPTRLYTFPTRIISLAHRALHQTSNSQRISKWFDLVLRRLSSLSFLLSAMREREREEMKWRHRKYTRSHYYFIFRTLAVVTERRLARRRIGRRLSFSWCSSSAKCEKRKSRHSKLRAYLCRSSPSGRHS